MSHVDVMPDALPRAFGPAVLTADIRSVPDDFIVEEVLGFEPSGEGEHVFLIIEKRDANTAWVAQQLARWAGVGEVAVGYAGLKDRHALTRQAFTVHLPGREPPALETLAIDGVRVLAQHRHQRKLPRGALRGNRFTLTLREVAGDRGAIEHRLAQIAARGVPNAFGEQRFGRDGGNLAAARAMFAGRRVSREKRSILLSAARSVLRSSSSSAEASSSSASAASWASSSPGSPSEMPVSRVSSVVNSRSACSARATASASRAARRDSSSPLACSRDCSELTWPFSRARPSRRSATARNWAA